MQIKSREMDRDLRLEGDFLRLVSPLGYEKVQRFVSPLSTGFLSLLRLKKLNCEKVHLRRKDGTKMRMCIMRSGNANGKRVGVLWLHGGGYVLGAPEMAQFTLPRLLLGHCSCVIAAPDYTLSAKSPYPAALNDAYAALEWMLENQAMLGYDYDKIVVGGESAGGGLAVALSLYARDQGRDCIGFQIPLYPMLDDRVTATSAHNDAPVWNTKANRSAWRIYLGDRVMNYGVPIYAAPARASDYTGLPSVISIVGTLDPFLDEDMTFYKNVKKAGTQVEYRVAKGCYHAFDMMAPYAKVSKRAARFLLEAYDGYVERYLNGSAPGATGYSYEPEE